MDYYAVRLKNQYRKVIEEKAGGESSYIAQSDFLNANSGMSPLGKSSVLNEIPMKDRFTAMIVSLYRAAVG